MNDHDSPTLLAWETPRLDLLGTIDDVRSDAGGDVDADGFPENLAS